MVGCICMIFQTWINICNSIHGWEYLGSIDIGLNDMGIGKSSFWHENSIIFCRLYYLLKKSKGT